jgi:hypothetical protein
MPELRNSHWRVHIAKCVLNHNFLLRLAENQTDARLIGWPLLRILAQSQKIIDIGDGTMRTRGPGPNGPRERVYTRNLQ